MNLHANNKGADQTHVRIQRGDSSPDPPPPLKNRKSLGFLSNTRPDPLKNRWWPAKIGIWILPPSYTKKKRCCQVGPPLTKLSGSAHETSYTHVPLLFPIWKIPMKNLNIFTSLLVCHLPGRNPPRTGPKDIKLFSCSTQLSMKFQLLIKAKILTNKEVSCFKILRCCIYHANKC